jgi:murein DD-endopeptidase MepM/ murein hydrolase activator NlpD
MKQKALFYLLVLIGLGLGLTPQARADRSQQAQNTRQHLVQPGDTWLALAWRYDLNQAQIEATNQHINRQRQPAIGSVVVLPDTGVERLGTLVRPSGGLLATAIRHRVSPWLVAMRNGMTSPYRPLLHRPLFLDGGSQPPQDLPPGFQSLELSHSPAHPGEALAFRARTSRPLSVTARLDVLPFNTFDNGRSLVGLVGTGAFFGAGEPELAIQPTQPPLSPLWVQPWRFVDKAWEYQQLTLTGEAAEIDQESIRQERERLFQIWAQVTPTPQWTAAFRLPIDNYLAVSSTYGVRRSYNGGPYRSYHEGVDFSAYGGTPVYAPAAGTVVLAELLYVRGGAVIIDHGLGVYSGFYHMSHVAVEPGQVVSPGQKVGEVGTTGLSTGNHLHWDLLVGTTWVDADAWRQQNMACWVLEGLERSCQQ